jgi:hypothetical protein
LVVVVTEILYELTRLVGHLPLTQKMKVHHSAVQMTQMPGHWDLVGDHRQDHLIYVRVDGF